MDTPAVKEPGSVWRDVSTAAAACSGSGRRRQRRLTSRLNPHRLRKHARSRDPSSSVQPAPSISRFGCGDVEDVGSGQPVSLTSDYHSEGHDLSLVNGLLSQEHHPAGLQTGVEDSMPSWDASSCQTASSDLSDSAPPAASLERKKPLPRSEFEANDLSPESCCSSGTERRSTSPSRRRRSVADRGVRKKRASHQEREARRRSLRNTANSCDSRPRRSSSEESAKDVWRGSVGQRCNIVCGMSVSMSSLQPHQPPPHRTSGIPASDISPLARQMSSSACGSLRRKRKGRDGLTDSVQGSWESVVNRENFWEALQPSYQFLMDDQLIHDCKEINAELVWDSGDVPELESCPRSMEQLLVQYTDLLQWLSRVQGDLYKSPRTITSTTLRQSLSNEMRQKRCERHLFSDRCCHLLMTRPDVRGELGWRQRHLLQKWDELEAITGVSSPRQQHEMQEDDTVDSCQIHDVRREVRRLERWFQEMDHRLGKISFRLHFSCIEDLADCMSYHQALHGEIQSHQVIVSSVRALCAEVSTQDASFQSLADQLELHWQQLYLRAYEWICHLETYQNQQQGELPSRGQTCWSESQLTDEPLCKIARIDSDDAQLVHPTSASEEWSDAGSFFEDDYLLCHTAMNVPNGVEGLSSGMCSPRAAHSLRDKGYSSENSSAGSSDSSAEPAAPAAGLLKLLDAAAASSPRRSTVNTSNVRCETVATADCLSDEAGGEEPPMSSARRMELPVTSTPRSYSVSERPADNCGTFYFRHESDVEEGNNVSALPSPPAQTATTSKSPTSADDLVSTRISSCDEVEDIDEDLAEVAYMDQRDRLSTADSSVLADDADIQQLVEQAENLVRCGNQHQQAAGLQALPAGHSGASRSFRDRHVRNWVAKQRTARRTETSAMECQVADNSCDASCESAGSESDRDSSLLTASDEDLSSSMVTCHEVTLVTSSTAAANHSVDAQTPTKVLLRSNKKRRAGQRPWSLHVVTADVRRAAGRSALSVSETALHQVAAPSSAAAAGGEKLAVTSSSSTTTLSAGAAPRRLPPSLVDSWCNARRSARRGLRRSAPLSSGSECADGGVSLGGSPPSSAANRRRRRSSWRPVDQPAACCQVVKSHSFTGTANLPDRSLLRVDTGGSTVDTDHSAICTGSHDNADESEQATPSAADVINTVEISSVSEQAWDPYQEYKPITELGSEGSLDVDTVRQLLDCDDYRNFIDSEDGGGSSQVSAGQLTAPVRRPPPARRQRRKVRLLGSDSADSDHPSVLQILLESADCLRLLQNRMQASDTSAAYVEIVRVCDDELARLEDLVTWFDPTPGSRDSVTQRTGLVTELHGVISRWRALRLEGMDRQRRADPDHRLQRRISAFGQQLASIDSCSSPTDLESIEQLQTRIHLSQELESRLAGCRRELGDLNADVHRHVVLSSSTSDDALKHEVAALYRLLEQISTRLSSQLERLVMLDATWREFLEAGEQLKMALASDRAAMSAVRRAALSGDQLTDEVTRVAQLLTPVVAADGVTQGQQQVTSDTAQSRMCGMREDVSSGYDSASSEEHSERVRRLGRMSRAAGRLQLLLQPTSAAWTGVQHTMTAATSELRDLQATCRDLVIQTTSPVEATQRTCRRPVQRTLSVARVGGAAPFCRLRRVMRVSLPFQLALMLCLCAAYLLEPTCCDNVNVFSMSMIPQLRYISGPPPI